VAVAVDVAPSYASGTALVAVTGTFTPVANSLLVAAVAIGNGNKVAGSGSSAVTDSRGLTWTLLAREAVGGDATAEIWSRDGTTSLAMTVTATSQITGQIDVGLQIWSLTGAAVQAGQTGATKIQATTSFSAPIVTTTAGSWVAGALGYADLQITLTANGITTIDGQVQQTGGGDTEGAFHATSTTGTPGSTTLGCTNSTGFAPALALAEILPVATLTTRYQRFRTVNPAVLTAAVV
jgi:hypothetical protein